MGIQKLLTMYHPPLLYFAVLKDSKQEVTGYAEYVGQTENYLVDTYRFEGVDNGSEKIETVWYDFVNKKYYYSCMELGQYAKLLGGGFDINLGYMAGGYLLAWVANSLKSYFVAALIAELEETLFEPCNSDEWMMKKNEIQVQYDLADKEHLKSEIDKKLKNISKKLKQYIYKYVLAFGSFDDDIRIWNHKAVNIMPITEHVHESLADGTFDRLNDGSLLKYHMAAIPDSLEIKWFVGKSEYYAYYLFNEDKMRVVFDKFYGTHPETKADFIIRIDIKESIYELSLYRYGLRTPVVIPAEAYQLIVFKNKFEEYRSDNFNQ